MAYIQERTGKNGDVTYRVQVRIKGYPTETATFERKTDAKQWAKKVESAMKDGKHFRISDNKKRTMADLIDRYHNDVLEKHPKKKRVQAIQLKWWKDQIGKMSLSDIRPSVLVEQRDKLLNDVNKAGNKKSPATVVRYMSALSHALNIALREWEWINSNPMSKVSKPKEPRGRVRYLGEEERKLFLDACKMSPNKFLYIVVVLALSTGMRRNEIMSLKWKDVDFKLNRIILEDTKNGERRSIPISDQPLKLLLEHRKRMSRSELLFPSKVDPTKSMDLRKPFATALKLAEIEDFKFHDLRHSAASYLIMNGASETAVGELLGHKTMQMVKRYSHLSESHITRRLSENKVCEIYSTIYCALLLDNTPYVVVNF
ncbi:MAG: site-specific integrase [Methylococcales bacterium]|jgi:integrase|nr:site-specific integrase [Methylococcales bacterium]